ncbi:MAG: hypothetical protein JJE30_17190 [Desulfuromonadales bacterium]|nr:hypothetical protein [Desulfuromonadales bacterium]
MNWITLISSGRTHIVNCGVFGRIEFIHTKRSPGSLADHLTYDARCHLWRASVALALKDMKITGRSTDQINREVANEFV